jgi:hypothetical protein
LNQWTFIAPSPSHYPPGGEATQNLWKKFIAALFQVIVEERSLVVVRGDVAPDIGIFEYSSVSMHVFVEFEI